MPGLEFEKNVQQRLDELKLRPSDTVWKNVEKNIREEKRRRRAILWLPILLLFLGTSGYFLINKNGFVSTETAVKTKPTEEKNNSITSTIKKEENKTANLQNEEKEKNKNQELSSQDLNEKSVAGNPKSRNTNTSKSTRQTKLSPDKKFEEIAVVVSNDKDKVQSLTKGNEIVDLNRNENDVLMNDNDEDLIEYAKINPSLIKGSIPVVGISIPENHSATVQTPEVDLNAVSALNKNDKVKSAKWQWGLDLSLGTSSSSSELGLLKTAQMDNGAVGVSVGSNFQSSAGRPSSITIEPGFYWAAGGFIQRNFSNSFALLAGLHYAQYSTRLFTGSSANSSRIFYNSGNFDSANVASQYTNRYHFLELPLTAQLKLNKSNSFPVFANLGMSVGWLLGANALNFEGNTGANSMDNDRFNETQFGIHGGFSFGVLNKSKYPVRVGPSFNYKLSQLMENASSNKHLLSFGVDFRVLFKK